MKPTLLILAAGMGSRYGSLKQIDQLGPSGETIIDYSVYDAVRAGFGKVVFVIRRSIEEEFKEVFLNRFGDKIKVDFVLQELDNVPEGISYSKERVKPWGTGQAILVAAEKINEPFIAINADDFYGVEAFKAAAAYLTRISDLEQNEYCMIGYQLKNTLSEFGSVSRGICETDPEQFLQTVTERTSIRETGGKVIAEENDEHIELDPDALVSMNFWGFTPTVFDFLKEKFRAFIEQHANQPKAEFYIPVVVNELIQAEQARVKVLTSTGKWFGITYKEDREKVVQAIAHQVETGQYPEKLW
ncbi:MAG TPA: sugar phosphate nucleotidyltransferase [Bacteroidales bacterium]|nr:sugar phosphate nucleotidyltransferase [Bacteroidales bacterium]